MARILSLRQIGALLFLISVTCLATAHAFGQLPSNQGPGGMETSEAARNDGRQLTPEGQLAIKRRDEFLRDYYKHLKRDVDGLVALATEFKQYDSNQGATLPTEMLKKVRKMEDLSHDLRKLLYNSNVPHIKKSGTDLIVSGQSAGSPAPSERVPEFQRAAGLCFELATHISDSTYHYVDLTNQDTLSAASVAEAKDIVHMAAKLEGLAHEVQEAYRVPPKEE